MEILGLLDTLESMIMDGFKLPFTKKVVIGEEKILQIIDKMRLVIQGGGGLAREAIAPKGAKLKAEAEEAPSGTAERRPAREGLEGRSEEEGKAVEVLQQAYQMAKEIRDGADKYADEVLANLEATSTRILRTIKAGRERLVKSEKG